jgi:hypothetical protein
VPTVDNFGQLGARPMHPELLDYLAAHFVEHGWSIKDLVRFLVMAEVYQTSSQPDSAAAQADPGNQLLSHFRVRRLEAEAIRDALLTVSGQLDPKQLGPSVGGASRRRSVYVAIRRNSLDPFLEAFDAPKPFSTQGRRDVTNVPAQSLALLNDRLVIDQADRWAKALCADAALADPATRIRHMFRTAFARDPDAAELRDTLAHVRELAQVHRVAATSIPGEVRVWRDLAQSLFNVKEFIFVP